MKGTTLSNRRMQYNYELFFVKRDDCAELCTRKKECKSFEHCNHAKKCGAIDIDLPKTDDNCLNVNGTKVCTNFCILNKATKPIDLGASEYDEEYDFCKQDGIF